MTASRTTVTAAVLTHHRPHDIAELVPLLLAEADSVRALGLDVDVLVVDNDPAGSGGAAVAAAGQGTERLRYVLEPEPGIAAARNRVLDECGGRDLVAFLDDDERPRPGWLRQLVSTAVEQDAAAVAGRTVTVFPVGTDSWIRDGGFLDRRHRDGLRTGDRIDTAATNNLLLDLRIVRRLGLRFDQRFAESGGEDTLFARMLAASGARLVWCDEAVVDDRPAAERMTRAWMLRRVYSHGVTDVRVGLALSTSSVHRARIRTSAVAGGGARLGAGLVRLGLGVLRRDARRQALGAQRAARGAGMIAAVFGHVQREYRR